jgi:hypothetical protein
MKKIKITESQLQKLVKEQAIKKLGDKIKSGADKFKAGVQNVVNKVSGNGAQPVAASPQTAPGRNLDQLKAEWSKVNQDMSNMRGYGEAVGQTEAAAKTAAMMNAKVAILKKMGKSSARFGAEIKEEALFKLENGNFIKLVVLEPGEVVEESVVKLNQSDLVKLIKKVINESVDTEGIPQEDLDAMTAEAQKLVSDSKEKGEALKAELEQIISRINSLRDEGKVDDTIEKVMGDFIKQKENEIEHYDRASVDSYLQSMIFDYKRKKAYEDYEREKIERRKTKKITKEDIIDIFVTALEGGSNYWYYIPTIPNGVRDIQNEMGLATSEAIGQYVLKGGYVQINDAEDEEEVLGNIDMDGLLDAIQKIKSDYPRVYENIIDEDYDADDADVFFQIAVMGEVTFG